MANPKQLSTESMISTLLNSWAKARERSAIVSGSLLKAVRTVGGVKAQRVATVLLAIIGFSLFELALAPNAGQAHGDIVFRNDFDSAISADAVGSSFSGNNEFVGVADLGIADYDRNVTSLRWTGVVSTNGIANVGDMSDQTFLIVGVNDFENFRIDDFRDAYSNDQDYQFASEVSEFQQASNAGYDNAYDTSGTFDLYDLQFSGLDLHVPASEKRGYALIGRGIFGTDAGDFGLAYSANTDFVDHFDASIDSRNLVTNPDFPLPHQAYAFSASGFVAVPEPSSMTLLSGVFIGVAFIRRRRTPLASREAK